MKIRNGFVSNSSSSSFCIYGVVKDNDDIYEGFIAKFPEDEQVKEWNPEDEDWDNYRPNEILEYVLGKLKKIDDRFEYTWDSENDQIFIGMNPMDIKDDETGRQFKNTVEQGLNEILGIDAGDCDMKLGEIDR